MLLKALYDYSESENLIGSIELTSRIVHLSLCLCKNGSIDPGGAWKRLESDDSDSKGITKITLGRLFELPAFPGVNSGGKANFLADEAAKILGIDTKTGDPYIQDDKSSSNAIKSFRHFWNRIEEAHQATGLDSLKTLLNFRERYILDPSKRVRFPDIRFVIKGKKETKRVLCASIGDSDEESVPLDKCTVMFSIENNMIFQRDSELHDYWKKVFTNERFAVGPDSKRESNRGLCLITGLEHQTIAESHRTPIKGVPDLPPIGGYLVSFDDSSTSLRSFDLEKAFQAPVSENAAAAYALGLNDILSKKEYTRRFHNIAICSWINDDPDLSIMINGLTIEPTEDQFQKFHQYLHSGIHFKSMVPKHFRSITLAANGGRVVVRRWLDVTLDVVFYNINLWFDDLELEIVQSDKSFNGDNEKQKKFAQPYRSIDSLAGCTARIPSEIRSDVFDSLHRAAYENANPQSLLPSVLNRLRIAAVESGGNIRFHANRFALIKLILNRLNEKDRSMTIEKHLSQTSDGPYNCGRLLAVLDDIQYRSHKKEVGADVVSRYYANASTFPSNVIPRLLRLSVSHLAKLEKGESSDQAAARSLSRKLNEICALFAPNKADGAPEFPGLLNVREQGRFALGFYQQKAFDQQQYLERKASKVVSSE